MIFEGFAPGTAQQLNGLKALRSRILTVIAAGGVACLLVRVALMV
jgi:hypothetical protein